MPRCVIARPATDAWPWPAATSSTSRGRLRRWRERAAEMATLSPAGPVLRRSARPRSAPTRPDQRTTSPPPRWTPGAGGDGEGDRWAVGGAGRTGYGVVTNGASGVGRGQQPRPACYQAFTDAYPLGQSSPPGDRARSAGRPKRKARWLRHLLPPRLDRGGPGVGRPHALAKAITGPGGRCPRATTRWSSRKKRWPRCSIPGWGALDGLNWLEGAACSPASSGQKLYPRRV